MSALDRVLHAALFTALCLAGTVQAQTAAKPPPGYDAALAQSLGADEHGMRHYVLVVLKTGATTVPKGPARDEIFAGHMANIQRLADEGKLAMAGPLDGVDGWRGIFVFAVADIADARKLTETDPVISSGVMVAEYHKFYGSAALMQVGELHKRVMRQDF